MTAGPGVGGATERSAEACSAGRVARLFGEAGRLGDDTPVWLRPLVAGDRDLLLAGFGALSSRSRHSRFPQAVSDGQFERTLPVLLDTVDQRPPVALLYTERPPIGLGRLRRFASDSGVADVAVTVADEWHGRGAGAGSREKCSLAPGMSARSRLSSARTTRPRSALLARLGELQSPAFSWRL
jgi:hypothetical protein